MGRKKKEIDLQSVEQLAAEFCTQSEIASQLNISERTVRGRDDVKKAFDRGQKKALVSLRQTQWRLAQEGNATMLIWLGKQYLNQMEPAARERIEIEKSKADIQPQEMKKLLEELDFQKAIIRRLLDGLSPEQLETLEKIEDTRRNNHE